jgi:hypothetical protein
MFMQRDDRGKWLRGCASPNPGGRPKGAIRRVRAICQDAAEAVIQEMIELALDPNQRARDRISAANIVLDRGLGKASPEMPDDDQEPLDQKARILRLMTPQLREHLGFNNVTTASLQAPETQTDTADSLE